MGKQTVLAELKPVYGQRLFATPAKGVTFRKENGEYIKAEGEEITLNSFWVRRENEGDVAFSLPRKEAESINPAADAANA